MIQTFDYKAFAKEVRGQAEMLIPEDIAKTYRETFIDRIYDFTLMAGESLANDENIKSPDTAKLITQLVSEWTFHKYVDLLRSDIPFRYHEGILQKIAFVAFEIAREAAVHEIPADKVCELVDFHLNKEFQRACAGLMQNGGITEDVYNKTIQLSHVDEDSYMSKPLLPLKASNKSRTHNCTIIMLLVGIIALMLNIFIPDFRYIKAFNVVMIVFLSVYLGIVLMYIKRKK